MAATEMQHFTLARRVTAEGIGTALLLAAVIGSGIMGERLSAGSVGLALLANTLATGAALVALILTFGPISGAHFNPAVTLAEASQGGVRWVEVPAYIGAQVMGAFAGVAAAHTMFEAPLFFASRHVRAGGAQTFSEFVATFGLVAVIWGCARLRAPAVPFAVAAYITPPTGSRRPRPSRIRRLRLPVPPVTPSPAFAPPTSRGSSSLSSSVRRRRQRYSVGSSRIQLSRRTSFRPNTWATNLPIHGARR